MSDVKRTRNATSPLGAGEALDRLSDIRETRAARRTMALDESAAAFDKAEREAESKLIGRVPTDQQKRLSVMLAAMHQEDAKVPEQDTTTIPTALLTPLPPERLAIGRK